MVVVEIAGTYECLGKGARQGKRGSVPDLEHINSLRVDWLVYVITLAGPGFISNSQKWPLNLYLKEEVPSPGLL